MINFYILITDSICIMEKMPGLPGETNVPPEIMSLMNVFPVSERESAFRALCRKNPEFYKYEKTVLNFGFGI